MMTLRVISSPSLDCFSQMAIDEALFLIAQDSESAQPIIRFYQFSNPCCTIGFSQRRLPLLESIENQNLPWVRRPTGGGVVWHTNDIIFSMVLPESIHPDFHCAPETYRLIHEAVVSALTAFSINPEYFSENEKQKTPDELICFDHPVKNDVLLNGDKIAGGAERRSNHYVLHQESLQLHGIAVQDFKTQLIREFEIKFGWMSEASEITDSEIALSEKLKRFKYQTSEWNWKGKTGFQKDHEQKTFAAAAD